MRFLEGHRPAYDLTYNDVFIEIAEIGCAMFLGLTIIEIGRASCRERV